jgi:chitinase
VTVADFNLDGRPDMAVVDGGSNLRVLLNDGIWSSVIEPRISIGDVTMKEGNAGPTAFAFTVSLSVPYDVPVTVSYATANGTATAGGDYQAKSGTLTFAPGETSKTVTVLVNGDRSAEPDETFVVNLGSPTNATIADGQGVATILDDEPRISINDVTRAEGKKGKATLFTFTVTLSAAYDQAVTMAFRTADGTAKTSDGDYLARIGTLTFAPGETTKTVTIQVKGDSRREADETFTLVLSGASGNASLPDSVGLGTIGNDDSGSGPITGGGGKRSIFDNRKKPRR